MEGAKANHVALEVNNSSLIKWEKRLNCYDNYKTMLKLCQQLRVPITVDSDAHDPSCIARVNLALELLESVNFDRSLVLNFDQEMAEEFLLGK